MRHTGPACSQPVDGPTQDVCYIAQALAEAAQPASCIGLLPMVGKQNCTHFVEKCHYFCNDDPYRHKIQHM